MAAEQKLSADAGEWTTEILSSDVARAKSGERTVILTRESNGDAHIISLGLTGPETTIRLPELTLLALLDLVALVRS
jgi:hypothetical protein